MSLSRRRVLTTTGAIATATIGAGCQSLLGDGGSDGDGSAGGSDGGSDGSAGDGGSSASGGSNGSNIDRSTPDVDPEELQSHARSVFESWAAGEYETAIAEFENPSRDQIGADGLEGIWGRVVEENGQYEEISTVSYESGGGDDTVVVEAAFAEGPVIVRFRYIQGDLVGLSVPSL